LLKLSNLFHRIKEEKAEVVEEPNRNVVTAEVDLFPSEPKKKKYVMSGKYSKKKAPKKRKYAKECSVIGCSHKGINLSIHQRMAHGITQDGEVLTTFKHSNRRDGGSTEKPVSHPVVKLQDGTYRQLISGKTETNFLDSTPEKEETYGAK